MKSASLAVEEVSLLRPLLFRHALAGLALCREPVTFFWDHTRKSVFNSPCTSPRAPW